MFTSSAFVFAIATLGLLSSSNAFGQTVVSVTYSPSNFYTTGGTTDAPIIYAGMTSAIPSGCTGICSSCGGSTLLSTYTSGAAGFGPLCSTNEISPSTNFTINATFNPTASTTTGTTYTPLVQIGSTFVTSGITMPTLPNMTAGSAFTIQFIIPWSVICQNAAADQSAACDNSFSTTVSVGWGTTSSAFAGTAATIQINYRYVKTASTAGANSNVSPWATWKTGPTTTDYEGIYYFEAFPGDGKVYINNPTAPSGFAVPDLNSGTNSGSADASGMKYAKARIFYRLENSTTAGAFTTGDSYQDLTLDTSNGSLSPQTITGLQNVYTAGGTQEYQFIVASVDQAGIATYWSDPSAGAVTPMDFTIKAPPGTTQAAQPQPVYGLLDGQGCFIASAAYGSPFEPQVKFFRDFRGSILMNSDWGRQFVRWYYRNSPPLAQAVAKSEVAKLMAQGILWPVLGFVKLALWLGLVPAILISLFVMVSLVAGIFYWRRRRWGLT